jgi:Protein of unknown function (DUF3455)
MMNFNPSQQTKNTMRVRSLFVAALVLACAFATFTHAAAQTVTPPPTPTDITPPVGNVAFLVGHAIGSQGYVCLPDTINGGTSWTINSARPEATLFVDVFGKPVQIITHFASINANPKDPTKPVPLGGNATWQSSFDTSKVWAAATGHIDASPDVASCPNAGSIQCLLLQSLGNQKGPTGGELLDHVSFVQRLNTKGGSAPTTACSVGQTQLVPYTADYFFYRGAE